MITISQGHNEARLEGTRTYLDTGAGNARIRIYGGTRPASGAATAEPMLVEIALDKPCGVVSSNALTLASSDEPLVANSGTATWARIVNGNGDFALDCDAGGAGSGAEIIVSDPVMFVGGSVVLVSGVLG